MTFETGDIILVKVNHFSTWYRRLLAKLIQFFDGVYYHHAGTIADGMLYEAETKVTRSDPRKRLAGDHVMVLRLRQPLTGVEQAVYTYLADESVGRPYDYTGTMLHQLIYIFTFRRLWIGKSGKSARKKPYCTELAVEMIHQIRGYFPQPWKLGPSGLLKLAPLYYDVVFEGVYYPDEERKAA